MTRVTSSFAVTESEARDIAARAISRELTEGPWGYLRDLQWSRPSAGGPILVMPDCFRREAA